MTCTRPPCMATGGLSVDLRKERANPRALTQAHDLPWNFPVGPECVKAAGLYHVTAALSH
ncbi:hypothetical protein ACO9S2_17610 [Nitrospira sp. NS4]